MERLNHMARAPFINANSRRMAILDLMWKIKGRIIELPVSVHRGNLGHTGGTSGDRQRSAICRVPRHKNSNVSLLALTHHPNSHHRATAFSTHDI